MEGAAFSHTFLYAKSLQLSGFLGARHTGRLWWFHMVRGFGVPGA
jgi:hypothetical protein